jgi:hypothetical protein
MPGLLDGEKYDIGIMTNNGEGRASALCTAVYFMVIQIIP